MGQESSKPVWPKPAGGCQSNTGRRYGRNMQLLKYFILKTPTNASGDVELRSDFMSYVDNEGQEEQLREDWMSNMV